MSQIDFDRGVHIRNHDQLNIQIFMYVDDPGVYLTKFGSSIPEVLAQEAGFDVGHLAKLRERKSRMAAAREQIEAELAAYDDGAETVKATKAGFTLVDIGGARYIVRDADGHNLTGAPLNLEMGKKLLDKLAESVTKAAKAEKTDPSAST